MLEQVYADIIEEHADDERSNARTTKRRKMDVLVTAIHASTPDGDDDDDVYYGAVHVKGKKAKGGTGYAGDGKEDVSLIFPRMKNTTQILLRLLGKSKLWPFNARKMRR